MAAAVGLDAQPVADRRGDDAGPPDQRRGGHEAAVQHHAVRPDVLDGVAGQDGHAAPLQRPMGVLGELLGKRRQQPRPRFHQQNVGGARIDAAEVAGQREPGQLGDGAGDLDAGRPAADDDGGHQRLLLLGIGRGLGKLERHQQTRADRPGVVDRFSPGAYGPTRRGRSRCRPSRWPGPAGRRR